MCVCVYWYRWLTGAALTLLEQDAFLASQAGKTCVDEFLFSPAAKAYLSFEQVLALLRRAATCEVKMHDEASWNVEVHHPLLAAVLRPGGRPSLVDVLYCPTARIATAYAPRGAPARMVDFCLTINPDHVAHRGPDVAAIEAQLRLGRDMNHSTHDALLWTPIAVSIETKRAMVEGAAAELQMGVWQSSLLRMLTRAEEALAFEGATRVASPSAADAAPSLSAVSEWLPGIIVHSHKWAFVATCRTGLRENRPVRVFLFHLHCPD